MLVFEAFSQSSGRNVAHLGSIGVRHCAWRRCYCCWSAISVNAASVKKCRGRYNKKFTTYPHNRVILLRCLGPKPSTTLHWARLYTDRHQMFYDLHPSFVRTWGNFCASEALMEGMNKVWTVRCQSAFRAHGVSFGRRSTLGSLLILWIIYR